MRPKILKTLIPKPYTPPPTLPPLPPEPVNNPCLEIPAPAISQESHEFEFEDVQVAEATSQNIGVSGNVYAATFFKYGAIFMVGGFVFQSICSFWFLLNYDNSSHKDSDSDSDIDRRGKRNLLFNGNGNTVQVNAASNVIYGEQDQLEMGKKIEEIKLMAREARRVEEMKKDEEEDVDSEIDDEVPLFGIEKEIGARLLNLVKRLNDDKDNSAALQINSLGNSVKNAGGVATDANKNVNKGKEELVFKKKLKFKSPSTKPRKTPKGFPGTRDSRASNAKKRDPAGRGTAQEYGSDATDDPQVLYEDKQVNRQDSRHPSEAKKLVDDKSNAILNHRKNLEEKMETPDTKTEAGVKSKNTNNGGLQETSFGKSAPEVIQLRELRMQNSHDPVEENRDNGPIFEKDDVHRINGSSRRGLAKKNSAANRVKVKQANTKTDMRWLNLRYVLVILMQRGSNGGQKALYRLKFTSKDQEQDQGDDDSYTVAFEDHADANNFCFLLESFFKDLGDFSADPVPMSIQEFNEEITSNAKKVVVVKKRQLQLYAGQSLSDVEMALCSLIEQDQNVP